jgi:spore coat protein CotF
METQQQDFNQVKQESIPYNAVQDAPSDERLSAFELGQLWEGYMADSLAKCLLQYFVAKAQDPEIRSVLEYALQLSTNHLKTMTQIFNSVGFPIPHGFTDEDVEPNAKRLFSDGFMLIYIRYLTRYGLIKYFTSLTTSVRPDVREFSNRCIDQTQDLHTKADEILIKKGFFSEEAYIPVPDRLQYVYEESSMFKGILGDKRPINALEIAQVFGRLESKLLERPIVLGFSQVVQSQKIQDLFSKAKQVLDKNVQRWSKILRDEYLPLPVSVADEITDSSESPFSDKLMLFHVLTIFGYGLTGYGIAIASCTRADIVTAMNLSIAETMTWAKDAMDLMIQSGWLEKIPQAANRQQIIQLQQ